MPKKFYTVILLFLFIKMTFSQTGWYQQVSGTGYYLNSVFFTDANTGFIAGDSGGTHGLILKTTTGGITFIQPIGNEIPNEFLLYQNYPNPFNPVTRIRFQIPLSRGVGAEGGRGVLLKVYDILGREVITLVNEQLKPGSYEVEWNASSYPGGVYFYTLSAGDFSETRKAILIK